MKSKIILALRLIAAVILLQTLYFKFSGASESKFIFETIGIEPWGRWLAGVSELIASILLLVPFTAFLGAAMALGIMLGALASHILFLGIVVQGDGGLLFGLACAVCFCCLAILTLRREEISMWIQYGKKLLGA